MRVRLNFLVIIIYTLAASCDVKQNNLPLENQTEKVAKLADEWLWAIGWSSEKNIIATGGTQEMLYLYAGQDRGLLDTLKVQGTITKVKWHPKKNALAITTQGEEASSFILDVDKNERIYLKGINEFGARALGWNNSGDLLAVGDYDGVLSIFNIEGKKIKRIDVNQKGLMGLAWHPKNDLLAVVGERIGLYDLDRDTLFSVEDRKEDVLMLCVDWHPSGKFFVTGDYGDYDKSFPALLQYWSAEGQRLRAVEKSKAEYRNLQWSQDGDALITASDRLRLWNQEGGLVLEGAKVGLLWGVAWSPNESEILTTDAHGHIHLWSNTLNRLEEIKY